MNLIDLDLFEFDLLIIIIAYLYWFYGKTVSGSFAFGQGLLIDIFSGGLHGLFTFLYFVVFLGVCLGARIFNLQDMKGQTILILLLVLLKKSIFFLVLTIFSTEVVFSKSFLLDFVASAIGTGLITPIFFYIFNRLRAIYSIEKSWPSDRHSI